MSGRPLAITWENENVDAILETWFAGTEAGNAIADVLFGAYNPSGKITATFPQNVGQVPLYYNHKNTGRPIGDDVLEKYKSRYLDVSNDPLYPFGFGLSYTKFEYGDIKLDKKDLNANGEINLSITISNAGKYDGSEIVQLYVRDMVASITPAVKELKDFRKIFLKARAKKFLLNCPKKTLGFTMSI